MKNFIKTAFCKIMQKHHESNVRRAEYYAREESRNTICFGDVDGFPYLFYDYVPLYRISNDKTDLVNGIVNICDANSVLIELRVKYVNSRVKY